LVVGIEGDIQGGGMSGSSTATDSAGDSIRSSESVDYYGTIRGRVGYILAEALIYGTGGFAYGDVKHSLNLSDNRATTSALSRSDIQAGYAAGGGIEYKFTSSLSAKIEYLHIDLGSISLAGYFYQPFHASFDTRFDTVRLGLNYHFGEAYQPLK
jgi:outer membrane immunogenic protein